MKRSTKNRRLSSSYDKYMHIISHIPEIETIWSFLLDMNLKQRSAVIKLCQAQYVPHPDETSALGRIIDTIPEALVYSEQHQGKILIPFRQAVYHMLPLEIISSCLYSAIILDLCRGLPLSEREIAEARLAGWSKELSLMETTPPEYHIRWEVLFDRQLFNESILPGIPSNRHACLRSYNTFQEWREYVSTTLHYPRMTFKNMSRETRRCYEDLTGEEIDSATVPIFGQINYERLYMRTGIHLGGALELRQRWYVASAKPRTYFAQGGETYHASKYLQDAFSKLVDLAPFTNHRTRLRPARLYLSEGQYLRIYDLEAFTSRCHEQKAFLDQLAKFCSGWPITYMDSREGVTTEDLGEVIWRYNQVANHSPSVSYERVLKNMKGITSRHNYAGALGVFGNLMTCTAAHGHLILQIVAHEDQLNCAGDDVAYAEDTDNESWGDEAIDALGKDQKEKRFRSDESGCICLKRPLYQYGNQLVQGFRLIPPPMYSILHHVYGLVDPRYRSFEDDDFDGVQVVTREVMRFLRSCFQARSSLTNEEKWSALYMVKKIGDALSFDNDGSVEGVDRSRYTWPAVTAMMNQLENCFDIDPLAFVMLDRYSGQAEIQRRDKIQGPTSRDFYSGNSFLANSSKYLMYLEKLGFLEKTPEVEQCGPLDRERFVFNKLYSDVPVVYEYLVTEDVPYHLLLD